MMEELRQKIIALINESGLPLEAIVFIIRDVYRDVDMTFQNYLKEEKESQKEIPSKQERE